MSNNSCSVIDQNLSPYAGPCRGGFDFTLKFEEIVITVLPLAALLLVAPFRILYLWRRSIKVTRSFLLPAKLVS